MRRIFGGVSLALALPSGAFAADASAAEASAAGAAEVKAALERYLGLGALTVGPSGSGYKLDIDVKAMLKGLERFGVTLQPSTYSLTLSPTGDGTWHVTSAGMPAISAKYRDQTTSIVSNGQTFDGSFDTRIPAFTQWTGRYDSVSIGMTDKGASTQTRQVTKGDQTFTATPAGDGVIDGKLSRSDASFAQDIAVDNPKAHVDIAIKSGRTTDDLVMEGLHVRALTDLWAFFVAHPSVQSIKTNQPALRALLRQALPLFQRWIQDGTLEDFDVTSPFGHIGARRLATHIDVRGLTAEGSAGLTVKADSLTVPTETLPPWSATLVPTGFELATVFSGYRLDEAARTIVDEFDLEAPQPLSKPTLDKLGTMVGPLDKMLIAIGASRVTSPTLDARFSGEIRLTQPSPRIALTVKATGLDKAVAAVQEASKQDPSAAQAMAMLAIVKGYGKAEPNGALTWAITMDETGAIAVNGAPLPTTRSK